MTGFKRCFDIFIKKIHFTLYKYKISGYNKIRWFEKSIVEIFKATSILNYIHCTGPLVKRLRHRPFTAVTRVRIPYGSPIYGGLAQLGEHLPYKQGVAGSSPASSTICRPSSIGRATDL